MSHSHVTCSAKNFREIMLPYATRSDPRTHPHHRTPFGGRHIWCLPRASSIDIKVETMA
jgi:hypothetical protein